MMKKKLNDNKSLSFYVAMILLTAFAAFPFVWTFLTSIKPEKELFKGKVEYIAKNPTFINYQQLMSSTTFFSSMLNSFIIAFSTAVIALFVSSLAAYGFSRYDFKGKYVALVSFLTINMFPPVLLLIPLYSIMRKMHLLFTPFALIIAYSTFTIPFSVWLLYGYINDLPVSLEEAAMVDGCNRRQAFIKIILPLTIPGIIATGVYIFITAWNEFTFASMFTNKATSTVPVALQGFVGQYGVDWGLLTAGGVVTTIPIVLIFMLVQKKLVEGLTAGAVKG
jgi:multiple sugar transport system permease protein